MTTRSVSRRHLLQMGGALAASGALAARTPLSALAGRAGGPVMLSFWTPGGSARYVATLNLIAQKYNKLNPNVQVGKVQNYTGQADYLSVLLARIAAGNPPDATIYWSSPVALAVVGGAEAIDELMAQSRHSKKEDWPASALASCQYNGKTYGLPVTAGSIGLFYNQEWFEQKGIKSDRASFPKTWDDLRKLSKEFTLWKGGRLETAGYIPLHDDDWPVTYFVWAALNGGGLYDAANHKYTIDAEPNVAMAQYMLDWFNEEYKGDLVAVERSANFHGYIDTKTGRPPAFQAGKLAINEQGSWYLGDFYQVTPKFHRWNVAQFPVGPGGKQSVAGFWPNWLVIPKGSQHPKEIFGFLDYLGYTGIKDWFAVTPDMPANLLVPHNLLPAVTVQNQGKAFAQDVMNFFYHQLAISIPLWNSPVQDYAQNQLQTAFQNIMYKKSKPREALAAAQQACQNQLNKVLKG